jgi:hypothetical protein
MRPIGFVWAAVTFGLLASPLAAQPIPPAQQASMEQPAVPSAPPPDTQASTAVPPAPPPDMQAIPGGQPPFPPMSKRPPQHRWVDMGGHHSAKRHRTTHVRHKARHTRHQLTRKEKDLRYCNALSHRRMIHNHRCVALMKKQKASHAHRLTRTEKNIRYCDSLSHRRMMHNRTCVALMKKHKATKHRTKAVSHRRHVTRHRRR